MLAEMIKQGKISKKGKLYSYSQPQNPDGESALNRQDKQIIKHNSSKGITSAPLKGEDTRKVKKRDKVKFRTAKDFVKGSETAEIQPAASNEIRFVTGRFEERTYDGVVYPDSRSVKKEILIHPRQTFSAKNGDKVLVEILNPEDIDSRFSELEGKVIEVLGKAGEIDAEIKSIMRKYGLVKEFSEAVLKETDKITDKISIKDRLDLRDKAIFTIDPADAKDFDDAVSMDKLDNGNYLLGVHIADVSHYVKENSELDAEALKRGTSVYLVNQVVPMLPERLSNHICSLRPNEDKHTFSCFIELNKKYQIEKYYIAKTIINSKRRFTYEEAQEIMDGKKGDYSKELRLMYKISKHLTKQRMKEGSLDFDTQEVKFDLDDKGRVKAIKVKHRLDSMRLIEEFMLLANKCVTEYVTKLKETHKREYPFVYRVHDDPDPEKLKNLSEYIKQFGYDIKIKANAPDKKELKKLLELIKGQPEEYIINDLLIRSMAKAIYTDKNIGHYGLGFDDYTHFTSPIRRYPDLIVHRLLYDYLRDDAGMQKRITHYKQSLPLIVKHCSEREQNAVNAERELIKLKQIEYMKKHIGETFEGIISGLVTHGMFVEIMDILVEGMVRFRDIKDDYYEYDERKHKAVGRRRHKVFKAGDKVKIKLAKLNMETRKIDFELV